MIAISIAEICRCR